VSFSGHKCHGRGLDEIAADEKEIEVIDSAVVTIEENEMDLAPRRAVPLSGASS
jgi:hypothetical protein